MRKFMFAETENAAGFVELDGLAYPKKVKTMMIENHDGTTISKQRIADLLFCAFEGGSAYWCEIVRYVVPPGPLAFRSDNDRIYRHVDYPLNEGGAAILKTNEDDEINGKKEWTLDYEAIKQGLITLQEKFPDDFKNFIEENEDAETGDVFLQLCTFGDVELS